MWSLSRVQPARVKQEMSPMSTLIVAEIQSIQGTAYAAAIDGTKRLLQTGDQLFEGEVLETSEGGAVQLLLTDGGSYQVAGIPQLLLSAELLGGTDSGRDESEVAATTFDALVEEGFGDTLEEAVAQSDTVIDQALEDIFSEELEATAAGAGGAGDGGAGSTFVQAVRVDTGTADDTVDGIGFVELTEDIFESGEAEEETDITPAIVANDAFNVLEDATSTGSVAESDTLFGGEVYRIVSGPANGSLTLDSDGAFTYTPDADYNGDDSFVYEVISPDGQSSSGSVVLTVQPVNDAPTAQNDALICPEDQILEGVELRGNDSDPDGDPLTVVDVQSSNGAEVTFNEDGTIDYKPAPNFTGTDVLTYTIDDGAGGTSTATLTVEVTPVNDAPLAVDDQVAGVEDQIIQNIDLLANDSDVDGDALTVVEVESSQGASITFKKMAPSIMFLFLILWAPIRSLTQ